MDRSQEIVAASIVVASKNPDRWSIEAVADRAGCAKGLVLYHFGSKAKLIELTVAAIAQDLYEARIVGLGSHDPIDGLWQALKGGVASGRFGAILRWAKPGHPLARSGLREAAARALAVPEDALGRETALAAALDGLALQLFLGTNEVEVRRAYEELWVSLVSAP